MSPWILRLIDDVPSDFAVKLSAAAPEDQVLGELPAELNILYRASVYAKDRADELMLLHQKVHDAHGNLDQHICEEADARSDDLKYRGGVLSANLAIELRDHFNVKMSDNVQIRREGAVILAPKQPEELAALLIGSILAARLGIHR